MNFYKKTLAGAMASILCFSSFSITSIGAKEANVEEVLSYSESFELDGVSYDFELEETDEYTKASIEVNDNSHSETYYDKENDILYQDGVAIAFTRNIDEFAEEEIDKSSLLYRVPRVSDLDPIYVATYNLSCQPLIQSTDTLISVLAALAGYNLASKLGIKDGLGKVAITSAVSSFGSKVNKNVTTKANVTFYYKLYRTRNPVLVSGATIKYTAYRYQDYTCKIIWDGKTVSKTNSAVGGW